MHPRLSVNTIGYGAVPVVSVLDDLAAHGIRRIGVPVAQLEAGDPAANVGALGAGGWDVVDIVEPSVFTLARPDAWEAQRDRLRRCVDLAAGVGAPILYVTTGPAGGLDWDEAAHAFRDAVGPVLDYAAAAGVRIAVENTVTLRADPGFLHGVPDAVDAAALPGGAGCADLFRARTDRD